MSRWDIRLQDDPAPPSRGQRPGTGAAEPSLRGLGACAAAAARYFVGTGVLQVLLKNSSSKL